MADKTEAINCIQDLIDVANSHGSAYIYQRNGGVAELENVLECLMDSEPARHGHWIPLKELDLCECSCCGRREIHYYDGNTLDPEVVFPYCHCGAKMIPEGEGE